VPRPATGTVQFRPGPSDFGGKWWGRVTCIDGSRPWVELGEWPNDEEGEQLARFSAAEHSKQMRQLKAVASNGAQLSGASAADIAAMTTWLKTWLKAREVRGLTSVRENRSHYEQHIEPALGAGHVRSWTVDDLRKLCNSLDDKVREGKLSWKTALNVWATACKMVSDACRSKLDALRCRTDDISRLVPGPDRGAKTEKQFLYPSEFLEFVSSDRPPLKWRLAVALAVNLYARLSELRALRWADVDLEHWTVHVHQALDRNTGKPKRTKTGNAWRVSIEPAVRPLLAAMHERRKNEHVFAFPSDRDMARGLRRWLWHAGVRREELHTKAPTRKALTFHDLRATGLTWMAVRGDDALKIQQRAGHTDFQTTQGYIRLAESVRDGFGQPFPTLPAALLDAPAEEFETSKARAGRVRIVREIVSGIVQDQRKTPQVVRLAGILQRGGRDSNPRPPA